MLKKNRILLMITICLLLLAVGCLLTGLSVDVVHPSQAPQNSTPSTISVPAGIENENCG